MACARWTTGLLILLVWTSDVHPEESPLRIYGYSQNDGSPVIVFDLEHKSEIRRTYYRFLGIRSSRVKSIWLEANALRRRGAP